MTATSEPAIFAALRTALDEQRDEHQLWMLEIPEGAALQDIPDGLPLELARLLAVCDGPNFGTSTRLFSAYEIASQQLPDHLVGAKLNDGSELTDASHFLFFGEAAENPLLVNETDGSVWRVPDDGVVWYTGCRLEQIANSLNEFVAQWVLDADRFLDLAGLTPSEAMDSDWYRLLKLSGLEA